MNNLAEFITLSRINSVKLLNLNWVPFLSKYSQSKRNLQTCRKQIIKPAANASGSYTRINALLPKTTNLNHNVGIILYYRLNHAQRIYCLQMLLPHTSKDLKFTFQHVLCLYVHIYRHSFSLNQYRLVL